MAMAMRTRQCQALHQASFALGLIAAAHSIFLPEAGAVLSAADVDGIASRADISGNGSASFVSLAGYPLARCLDGSSSGYYIRNATTKATQSSFLFLLDGGGLCTTETDCKARALTDLGSSKSWPPSYALNATDLTTPDQRNPFAAWTMVYLQYCDGSMHSGARTSASAETFGLWFAGHHTIAAVIHHLAATVGLNASGISRVPHALRICWA